MNTELQVEYWPIESVKPYLRNARKHSKKQVTQVAGSFLEFGIVRPILVDENGTIMAGHCCFEATKEIGLKVIPVIQAKHLSKAQVKAYRLADNRLLSLIAKRTTFTPALSITTRFLRLTVTSLRMTRYTNSRRVRDRY